MSLVLFGYFWKIFGSYPRIEIFIVVMSIKKLIEPWIVSLRKVFAL